MVTIPEAKPLAWLLRAQVETLRAVLVPADFPANERASRRCTATPGADRLPAVHLGQHRQPEGRGADPRQPARQRARDGQGGARHAGRRVRELAAALPRHGADRRLLRHHVPRLPGGADVAARLPRRGRALAARHPPPPRHASRAGRTSPTSCACGASRTHELEGLDLSTLALRLQRRRAGQPGDHDRLQRRSFAQVRLPPQCHVAGLRPGRVLGRPRLHAAGRRRGRSTCLDRERFSSTGEAVPAREGDPAPLKVVALRRADPGPRAARGRRRRASSCPTAPEGRCSSAALRRPPATTATRRRPRRCSTASG